MSRIALLLGIAGLAACGTTAAEKVVSMPALVEQLNADTRIAVERFEVSARNRDISRHNQCVLVGFKVESEDFPRCLATAWNRDRLTEWQQLAAFVVAAEGRAVEFAAKAEGLSPELFSRICTVSGVEPGLGTAYTDCVRNVSTTYARSGKRVVAGTAATAALAAAAFGDAGPSFEAAQPTTLIRCVSSRVGRNAYTAC